MRAHLDFTKKDNDRSGRRKVFHAGVVLLTVPLCIFLLWKLKALLLPIVVGALLAYLFRPVKDRFRVSWIPHELRVLILFACVGLGIFLAINKARQMVPDEKQKLELKVRLKYKVNEKFQEIVGTGNVEKRSNPLAQIVSKEMGPAMDQLNKLLDLDPDEVELFQKYRVGYKGQPPIEDRFFDYFQANQTTSVYTQVAPRDPASGTKLADSEVSSGAQQAEVKNGLMEELSIWILAPLIFIFLGFDNGQMRKYFIGLVPNRYFELSLTVMDMLDDAIGKYLRGTLIECSLVGMTLAIGLFLLGIPFPIALAIGFISGMANAIPFLGPAIGLVIALAYSLIAESITPLIPWLNSQDLAVYVVVLIAIAHVLDNVVYQPIVLGNAVNLHPLVVIVAIIGGSVLMGVWGMLLAIPTVVVVKTAVETLFKELKDYRII
jgi:predicted PurR-regulated permease PerM